MIDRMGKIVRCKNSEFRARDASRTCVKEMEGASHKDGTAVGVGCEFVEPNPEVVRLREEKALLVDTVERLRANPVTTLPYKEGDVYRAWLRADAHAIAVLAIVRGETDCPHGKPWRGWCGVCHRAGMNTA